MSRYPAFPIRPVSLAISLALATAASAQAPSPTDVEELDEVVVTAAGYAQKLVDAPASISVVSAKELEQRPYITMIDAVRDLEGVDVGETSDKTGQKTISIRGMGSDYTLVLVDGKRQNNHGDIYPNSFGGNQFGHIPPLNTVERIEVIRGPASTLYGADALGGVINIITRPVSDRWTGSSIVSHSIQEDKSFGSDTTYELAVSGPLIQNRLGLSLRGSRYERDASLPKYETVYDPAGQPHQISLGFGGGGKTVDNTNKSYGGTLNWIVSGDHDISFDFDTSKQVYDNRTRINDDGVEEYPVGTVDDYGSMLRIANNGRIEPRAGYAPEQEFSRNQWSVAHRGRFGAASSLLSLAHIDTGNEGRTLPYSVAERQSLQTLWNAWCQNRGGTVQASGYCPTAGTGYANPNAWNNLSEAQKLAAMQANLTPEQYAQLLAYLPRPKRNLDSKQYTLDAKLDLPVEGFVGRHHLVVGGQYIDGKLDDGAFGMEGGGDGAGVVQKHQMFSLFAEDNWTPIEPLTFTAGLRYDDHKVFGSHVSPRGYAVWTISPSWTIKGGVSTGYKTPKTTDLFDGITGFGGQGVSPFVGNPDLKPETSLNTDIALYWTGAGHNFNVTYFHNDFKDKITSSSTQPSCELTGGVRPCMNLGAYTDLGYESASQKINVDKAKIRGVEVAGRYRILAPLSLRANYTYTDSEQTTGSQAGRPLTNTARHMANATLDWSITPAISTQLGWELRSNRFRGVNLEGQHLYYKSYDLLNLNARYRFNRHVTINARVNNLLDTNFATGDPVFTPVTVDGEITGYNRTGFNSHYNNVDKARNYWLSLNLSF